MNSDVIEAIKKSAAVPSIPQVVVRFLEVISDPTFDYNDLVKVLSVDPGTVSELLRLTNSPLFGIRGEITNLRQALTLLGPRRTRSMVLGRYLVATLGTEPIAGLDLSYYWRRSLVSAVLATRFAGFIDPKFRDEAFISALLADIGVPILAEAFPNEYAELAGRYAPQAHHMNCADEQAAVGAAHPEISAIVLHEWGLPDLICNAVRDHHDPPATEKSWAMLSHVLDSADRVARLLCESPDPETVAKTCSEATESIGLNLKALHEMLGGIERDVEELATALRINVISSQAYSVVTQVIQEELEVITTG